MFDKVFISYAREDYDFAEKLYLFLLENGFYPWLDKKMLLPGQLWDYEIRKAIREANYVIILLSHNSVEKRGYIQREFKLALKYCDEKLEDDIYIIPVKVTNCIIPPNLVKFQWVDFEKDTFNQILYALRDQQGKYLVSHERQLNIPITIETTEIKKEYTHKKGEVSFKIESNFTQFSDNSNRYLAEINKFVEGLIMKDILTVRSYLLGEHDEDILNSSYVKEWYHGNNCMIRFLKNNIVSFVQEVFLYTGGAHGSTSLTGFNFFLYPAHRIELSNLFFHTDHETVLNFISDYCFNALRKIHNDGETLSQKEIEGQNKSMFNPNSLDPEWKNFDNFLISRDCFSVIFNQYQVSSYAFGIQIIHIPIDEFKQLNINLKIIQILEENMDSPQIQ